MTAAGSFLAGGSTDVEAANCEAYSVDGTAAVVCSADSRRTVCLSVCHTALADHSNSPLRLKKIRVYGMA
jgi:hypothetical protein